MEFRPVRPRARLLVHPGGGFSIFDDSRVEVEGYRGAETITDQGRVGVFARRSVSSSPPLSTTRLPET